MAVAAALLLVPTAYAQEVLTGTDLGHEKYIIDTDKGIGYNKYLKSTTPDANGNYTLRIENFITGDVKSTAVPTDFVLVLDASGSMEYDYRPNQLYPPMNSIDGAETWAKIKDYIVPVVGTDDKFSHLSVYYTWAAGNVGSNGQGSTPSASNRKGTRSNYPHFVDEGNNASCSLLYHYESTDGNNGYYKIFRRLFDASDGCLLDGPGDPSSASTTAWKKYASSAHTGTPTTLSARPATVWYNLAIKLKDGTYKYLNGSSLSDTPSNATGLSTILFINDGNLVRLQRRREALVDGVEGFVELIAEENAKDQWADNIPAKHQVAIVRFSGDYPSGGASIVPPSGYSGTTHVMNDFAEINDAASFISTFEDKYFVSGSTYVDYGMHLALMLLQDLQTRDSGKYAARIGGSTNRNKVVVYFTDGEPNHGTYFACVTPALRDAKTVKAVGSDKICGKVYSIDLAMSSQTKDFLGHLSSNYPYGDATATSGGYSASKFTGSKVPIAGDANFSEDQPIYYKDSNDGDLRSVFSSIAAANTGAMSSTLVAVDVMSDSFKIPFTSDDTDEVTMYTAQCIGKKKIDGEEYLAFAEPIKVKNREALDELWVIRPKEGSTTGENEWVNLAGEYGIDIDNKMKFQVVQETDEYGVSKGKSIVVSGFNYADLWCGHDGEHNNTRQIEDDDPNYAYQLDGYRGFKLIFEFPIKIDENALGGVNVPTNDWATSGLYQGDDNGNPQGNPEINYPTPDLPVPVKLIIQKKGLQPGESANFTIQRKLIGTSDWEDFTTFVLTGDASNTPEIRFINLDASYYYKVKEGAWSWAYEHVSTEYTTENTTLTNPLVFNNTPEDDTPKHAEAKAVNRMYETTTSTTTTINSK